MNILLIFFAIPIAVIVLSIILETFMKSPLKVAGVFFSIFLVIAFYLGGTAEYIVASLVYTLISIISAYITELILSRTTCHRENTFPEVYSQNLNRGIEPEFELPSAGETTFNNENNYCRRYR